MKRNHVIILAFSLLLFISLACGSSNEGTRITPAAAQATPATVQTTPTPSWEKGQTEKPRSNPTATQTPQPTPTETPKPTPTLAVFQMGDFILVGTHAIRLNSIQYHNGVLIADFLIENKGNSSSRVSSLMSFSARKQDGTSLDQEIFDCNPGLDGQVLPGDRLRGKVCWLNARPEDGIRIYYEANLFGRGAVIWEAVAGESEPKVDRDAELQMEVFAVGNVVKVKEYTIVLNQVTWKGDLLQANFTIENPGNVEVMVSSMGSFYARKRDGSTLAQEIFGCDSSLDGKVLPGDRLKGNVCWSGANADDGIKIYYRDDLFGKGAVVWRVE